MRIRSLSQGFLGFDNWGCRAQGGGQAWVGEFLLMVFLLHESTVKATFNTPCELLRGGYQKRKPGVLYESWGINPYGPV